jgi:2-dehydro-3-deoxy-D-gluconate 5-dehydrogenase
MGILEQFKLNGKTALVTGRNKGIGKAMAIGLAEDGADIIGVSANLQLSGSDAEKDINASGKKFTACQCDFADRASLKNFTQKVTQENQQIDILVNNAGTIMRSPAAEHSDGYWDKVMAINLDAQFIITREAGKKMIAQGSGKIISTASLLSFQGGINVPGYAASKGAIASLIKAFANEWAGKGINVNGIAPG